MGLLDEAIRQHLELKRQHGASDEELQMQEQEALGPVRREPAEPAAVSPAEPDAALETPGELAYDEAEPAAAMEPADYEAEPADVVEPAHSEAEPADAVEPADYEDAPEEVALEGPAGAADEDLHEPIESYEDSAAAEPEAGTELLDSDDPPHAAYGPEPDDGGATPSRGFEAVRGPEPGVAEEGEGTEDDVLEDTPEFLQETPEHDRLWFEQKPPRDFDFDD